MDERSIISFSKGEIEGWRGLRAGLSIEELNGFFGGAVETDEERLGYYRAAKYIFPGGLIAYVRQPGEFDARYHRVFEDSTFWGNV